MTGIELSPVGAELLDDPAADPAVVRESLGNIARANRWFGGRWAVRYALRRLLQGVPAGTRLVLLDLGTGLGDLPLDATRWAHSRGITLVPLGLERSPVAAALARSAGLPTVLGCAGSLPVRDRGVDLVLLSQVAHHLTRESAIELFRRCDALARHGVIVADLRRGPLGGTAFRVGGTLLGFDRTTLADGVTSLRRGYTRAEFAALFRAAGVPAQVTRRPGYRLVAAWRTGGSAR